MEGCEKQPCRHQSQRTGCSRCLSRDSPCRRSHWSRHPHCRKGSQLAGGHALKELWSMENPCWSRLILKCCSPWERATLQKRKRMRGRRGREELLWTYHSPHSLHCLEGGSRGVRNEQVKLSRSKRGTLGKVLFCLSFSVWYSILMENKLN